MNVFKKIISILSWICYALIFVYVLICLPMIMGNKPLVVLSGSMEPTYKVGSIIYFHKVSEDEIKVGDAVTFAYESGDYITHRITSIENGEYETKGDANNTADARKITFADIQGKVSNLYIPYLGYYVSFVNQHLYLIIIVIVILALEFLLGLTTDSKVETLDREKVKKEKKNKV